MIKVNLQKFIGSIIIIIIIVILIKITPFYNYSFDNIIQTKQQIIIYSQKSLNKSEWLILIEWKTKQSININNWLLYLPLNNQDWQKISFMAKEIYNNMYIFIQLTWNIIKIYPQSAIYINKELNTINIINWKIWYLNLDKQNEILFKWKVIPLKLDPQDDILNNISKDQKNNNRKNIIGLYWWNIILNKTFDYIIYKLLILFSKISPLNYKDNLQNYYDFNNYINKDKSIQNQLIFKKNEKNYINRDIFKQFNKWLSKIINSF
jgi:hypothetical protein